MKLNFLKRLGVSAAALTGLGLAASMFTAPAHADQWDKMTMLTFNEPTQVNNTYLEPGTYMFVLASTQSMDRHIVQIYAGDRSHLIKTVLAIPSYHMNAANDTEIAYWETPPGSAKAVRTWTYPGDNYGQEFPYPSQLRQVAAVTQPTPAPAPAPIAALAPAPVADEPAPPAPPVEVAESAPVAAPLVTAPEVPQEVPQQAPVEIAQNIVPDNVPNNAVQPQAASTDDSQALPKTASSYPLFGMGGLFSLGLYAMLRMKAVA